MDLLHELRSAGSTIVMVTHDERLGAAAERRLFIRDGQVQSEAEPLEA